MSRYIDADVLIDDLIHNRNFYPAMVSSAIKNTPTADVVEVVRCKDCKYLYCLSAIDRQFYCRHHPQGLRGINIIEDNPYCSYGERKEENEG